MMGRKVSNAPWTHILYQQTLDYVKEWLCDHHNATRFAYYLHMKIRSDISICNISTLTFDKKLNL